MKASLFFTASCLLLFASCHTKLPIPAPKPDELPPYTERGANTFGCLIDGQVFVPKKNALSNYIALQCYYQYNSGKYVLGLSAGDYVSTNGFKIALGGNDSIDFIQQGATINLRTPKDNAAAAGIWDGNFENVYSTTDSITGYIKINKLDYSKQIISGVFAFDALDTSNHKIIHITEGRFDVLFTQ